ncbi:MAG: hypothetical protein V5A68_02610 [Candidatus Thermoplasmatota archaeon]
MESTKKEYSKIIENTTDRKTNNIIITQNSTWTHTEEIKIDVTIKNNGQKNYFGFLKTYITEINSRWKDYSGENYKYGLLDIPLKKIIFLKPGETKSYTKSWDTTKDYPDLEKNNTMIFSTTSHILPRFKIGYQAKTLLPQYHQFYFAFYNDQIDSMIPK